MSGPSIIQVTAREGRALADRLYSRAISRFSPDDTEARRRDLRFASKLLRVLLRDYGDRELIEIDMG